MAATVSAISYSPRWTGGGYPTDDPPTIEMMTDGLTDRFYGSMLSGSGQFFRIELSEDAEVTSVIIGSSTTAGGWGQLYINDAILEWSLNGTDWTTVTTLTGFTTGSLQTIPVGATCRYLRVRMPKNEWLAIGEFDPTIFVPPDPDQPWSYGGSTAATFGGTDSFTYGTEGEATYGD